MFRLPISQSDQVYVDLACTLFRSKYNPFSFEIHRLSSDCLILSLPQAGPEDFLFKVLQTSYWQWQCICPHYLLKKSPQLSVFNAITPIDSDSVSVPINFSRNPRSFLSSMRSLYSISFGIPSFSADRFSSGKLATWHLTQRSWFRGKFRFY